MTAPAPVPLTPKFLITLWRWDFLKKMVVKAIQEHGEENTDSILETLHHQPRPSPVPSSIPHCQHLCLFLFIKGSNDSINPSDTHNQLVQTVVELKLQNKFLKSQFE
ncbi:hypothetical protein COP2_008489 [Malus domestica]